MLLHYRIKCVIMIWKKYFNYAIRKYVLFNDWTSVNDKLKLHILIEFRIYYSNKHSFGCTREYVCFIRNMYTFYRSLLVD